MWARSNSCHLPRKRGPVVNTIEARRLFLVGNTALATGAIFLLIFCGLVRELTGQTTSRDSARIRIVENPALGASQVRFRLASRASFSVGGMDAVPDLEFNAGQSSLLRAVPLLGGGLAVLDVTRVQIFSPKGVRERVIGRAGGGPREFRELYSGCALRGDTLVVFDGQLSRAVTLSPRGEFARTTHSDDFRSTLLHACFDDGTILVKRALARRAGVADLELARMQRDGTTLNVVARVSNVPDRDMVTKGAVSAAAAGRFAYFGDGRAGEIRVYSREGELRQLIRTRDRPLPITAQDIETELERTFPPGVNAGNRTKMVARARANLRRTTWPVYEQILPGDNGRLWVQHYRRFSSRMSSPFASESWTAFDSLGRMEGRLVLPAPVHRDRTPPRVIAFARGGVLMLQLDDDGAARFSLYPLQTVGGPLH